MLHQMTKLAKITLMPTSVGVRLTTKCRPRSMTKTVAPPSGQN